MSVVRSLLNEVDEQWHVPAQADDALGDAYRKLLTFKNMFDQMEEIPNSFGKLYSQIGKSLDLVGKARQETTQLRELAKRAARR